MTPPTHPPGDTPPGPPAPLPWEGIPSPTEADLGRDAAADYSWADSWQRNHSRFSVWAAALCAWLRRWAAEARARAAAQTEVESLKGEVLRLSLMTDEMRELDAVNAGAVTMARKFLEDDGSGVMSPGPCADAQAEWRRLRAQRDALARFKAFVHSYLGAHGVPEGDPDNEHQKQGCRIGARLDLLLAERDRLRQAIGRCCQCRFEHGEQYEECHLHKCQRCVRTSNGDPTAVTLQEALQKAEAERDRLRARVAELEARPRSSVRYVDSPPLVFPKEGDE